ncbi:conserved hypothetical protein [Gammaproteobacteria bacterium]
MSGEVVLVSAALGPLGALGVLGVAAATVASRAVTAYLDHRHAEAERTAATEQKRLAVWNDFQAEQAQRMVAAQENLSAFRGQLAALQLTAPAAARTEAMSARGFLAVEDPGLTALGRWFTSLPEALRAYSDFPVVALEGQWQRLQTQAAAGSPPAAATVAAFRMALEQTLRTHLERLDREQTFCAERLSRAKRLLEESLRCRHVLILGSDPEPLETQLAILRDELLAHLSSGEITEGALEVLEHQGATLTAEVNTALERAALRTTLRDRTALHLAALGYTMAITEEDGGQWRIPGGERVRLKIQHDHRLAFQVIHERPAGATGPLNATEQTRLRTQEGRWCADTRELLRRLTRDGFAYALQFERALPLTSVPVVVMESADELAADEEERARYHEELTRQT